MLPPIGDQSQHQRLHGRRRLLPESIPEFQNLPLIAPSPDYFAYLRYQLACAGRTR